MKLNSLVQPLPSGCTDLGNNQVQQKCSDGEIIVNVAEEMIKKSARLEDKTIDLAIRSQEAREFLDWHTDHVKGSWMEWMEQSTKVLEDIRKTHAAIRFESKQLLSDCSDIRKFFLGDDHQKEITRLKEFVELAERLRDLKADGTLDKLADTILKLS